MATPTSQKFNPGSTTFARERFSVLAEIRAESPVCFVPSIGMWAVTGYDAIREVLAEPAQFRSGGTYIPVEHLPAAAFAAYPASGPLWQHSMVSSDGDQHRRLRSPMARAFTARRVNALTPAITEDAAHLLSGMFDVGRTGGDLFAEFVRPLPSRTIARFFGLPVEEAPRLSGWSDAFVVPQVPGLPEAAYVDAAEQFAAFDAYVREIITGDLDRVGDGILRSLVDGWRDGSHDLTEDELVGDIANVVFAGHETTVSTLSNVFVRLLRDRPLWASLAEGMIDVGPLTEELLRVDTAGIGLFRTAVSDCQLAGVELPAGAKLWVAFGAANRDPAAFAEPDTMRLGRDRTNDPVTFGHGVHVCIGPALARAQVRIAVSTVPRTFPTLRLTGDVHEVPNYIIRVTPHIPVALSA